MSAGGGAKQLQSTADFDFVSRIASGDRAAEAEFVRKYERGVRVLVRRHCRPNDPVVDDLTQDVLTRLIERLRAGGVRDPSALPAYVRATVVHTTSAEYRRRRVTEPTSALDELPSLESPSERIASGQVSELLAALLTHLPVPRDREILVRFYLEEQDKDTVCRALSIDTAHFHRVVFRARERFRALLLAVGIGEA